MQKKKILALTFYFHETIKVTKKKNLQDFVKGETLNYTCMYVVRCAHIYF